MIRCKNINLNELYQPNPRWIARLITQELWDELVGRCAERGEGVKPKLDNLLIDYDTIVQELEKIEQAGGHWYYKGFRFYWDCWRDSTILQGYPELDYICVECLPETGWVTFTELSFENIDWHVTRAMA
jgi:hypothetical protein